MSERNFISVKVFLGYEDDIDEHSFTISDDKTINYVDALRNEYDKTKCAIDSFMQESLDKSTFYGMGDKLYSVEEKVSEKPIKMRYAQCNCRISTFKNSKDKDELIDEVMDTLVQQSKFYCVVSFDLDTCDDVFGEELKFWEQDSKSFIDILNDGESCDERCSWALSRLPTRDLVFGIYNKKNEMRYFSFNGTKILNINENAVSFAVESVTLANEPKKHD